MNNLYVMMGLPGSGKSNYAHSMLYKEEYNNIKRFSSDDLREEMFGFRDQTHNDILFAELNRRVIEHSEVGDVIYDATSLTKKDRRRIIETFKKYFNNLYLICMIRPINELINVNIMREGTKEYIPVDILLNKIFTKFELPTLDEGWEQITYKLVNITDDCLTDYDSFEDMDHNNPHHNETLKQHIDLVVSKADDPQLKVLAFYHDLGKFFCAKYNEEKGYVQYIGHANISAYMYICDHFFLYIQPFSENVSLPDYVVNHFIDANYIHNMYFMYYAILYHDIFYAIPDDMDHVIKSLSKPSKSIVDNIKDGNVKELAEFLYEFNKIDSMRE